MSYSILHFADYSSKREAAMNCALFHGTGSGPHQFWFPWLSEELRAHGHAVWAPQLPKAERPDLKIWLPFVLNSSEFKESTVLVGHSAGCPLVLSLLEASEHRIQKAVLVAGFCVPLEDNAENPILQTNYDWAKIKRNIKSLVIINSDNDPWGCDARAGKFIFDQLGGTFILRHGEGHMGSESFNQPYREFPLLLEIIESTSL